jgi:hypothetical protein
MAFDWGSHPTLVMKKGQEVVGEEVRDKERIAQLSARDDVWFMHRNFVIYKNKISFPQDVMKKICYFEIPCLPAEWCVVEGDKLACRTLIYANPSTLCDVYLKEQFFKGTDEKGLGTILIGVSLE